MNDAIIIVSAQSWMKLLRVIAALVFIYFPCMADTVYAADVDYQPPMISIDADHESLDSVLRSISKAMHITVTVPADLNKSISVHISNMPVQQAFRNLLGDMNYALQWEGDGKRLSALIVIVEGTASAVVIRPDVVVGHDAVAAPEIELPEDEVDLNDEQQAERRQGHRREKEGDKLAEDSEVEEGEGHSATGQMDEGEALPD